MQVDGGKIKGCRQWILLDGPDDITCPVSKLFDSVGIQAVAETMVEMRTCTTA